MINQSIKEKLANTYRLAEQVYKMFGNKCPNDTFWYVWEGHLENFINKWKEGRGSLDFIINTTPDIIEEKIDSCVQELKKIINQA
jgi:hypothetical protein